MRLFHTPPIRRRGGMTPLLWLFCAIACLLLGISNVSAEKTAADYFVHSLPGQPDGPLLKMHAGHIEVDPENNGNLFFWHFQNRHIANRQRTVIWLNGGPGCSSMDGALMELGPYRLKDNARLEYNDGSWDEFANLLFVDQPVGTGFSYVNTNRYLHELPEMARQFMVFLEKWFAMFPEYEHDDIYIAGESYAGQHIPYITQAILDKNREAGKRRWNVKGLLMGNAWIDPAPQYVAYLDYAYKRGLVQGGTDIARQLEAQQSKCLAELQKDGGSDHIDLPQCEYVLQEFLRLTSPAMPKVDDKPQCYNMYDVRLRDEYSSCGMNWPPDLTNVTPYLRRADVIAALHVNADKRTGWTECSGAVGSAFRARNSKPSIHLLPPILEAGIPMVLFSGDQDLICNHLGTEQIIKSMSWSGGKGFELEKDVVAPKRDWVFEGESAGFYQEARNLTYILFYNSSHMVPFDYPRRTRDMLDRFMGVDIASIGGKPADSRIDGEKAGLETSVGGHPNSTVAEEEEKEKLKQAEWKAYYKSGEAALVIVAIAATVWGIFVWRDRRRRRGYKGLSSMGNENARMNGNGSSGLEGFRRKRTANGDVEAGDFDESELDDLNTGQPRGSRDGEMGRERYSVGGASDDDENEEDGMTTPKANPKAKGLS